MYGDPDHLDAIADSLESRAEQIDARADELVTRCRRVQWHSTAAEAMRGSARGIAVQLRGVGRCYREAAQAVRNHARAVRRMLGWIADIERFIKRAVAEAWDRIGALASGVGDLVETGADVVGDAVSTVGSWVGIGEDSPEPDPADVQLCQQTWPPPGHKDWLNYADLAKAG